MAWTDEDKKEMDDAAEAAIKEAEQMIEDRKVAEAFGIVAVWVRKHYMKAGYKRLMRWLKDQA